MRGAHTQGSGDERGTHTHTGRSVSEETVRIDETSRRLIQVRSLRQNGTFLQFRPPHSCLEKRIDIPGLQSAGLLRKHVIQQHESDRQMAPPR